MNQGVTTDTDKNQRLQQKLQDQENKIIQDCVGGSGHHMHHSLVFNGAGYG